MAIDENGVVIEVITEGTPGPPGPPGSGILIRGEATYAEILATVDPAVGDMIIQTDDTVEGDPGDGWIWDGGQWVNAGPVRGPEGPQGPQGPEGPEGPAGSGVTIQGSATYANILAVVSPNTGDMWIQTDDTAEGDPGDGWVWDGAQWSNVGPIRGPAGPAGADGADGAQGPAGAQGPQGPAGAQGPEGPQGPQGPQGPEGPAGADAIGISDAPNDGTQYARQSGTWTEVTGGGSITPFDSTPAAVTDTPTAGVSSQYARGDHAHDGLSQAEADARYAAGVHGHSYEASGAVTAHEGAADPHTQYVEDGDTLTTGLTQTTTHGDLPLMPVWSGTQTALDLLTKQAGVIYLITGP